MSRYLTVAQASDETTYHRVTLWRALESGRLHGIQKIRGGKWLIEPDCLHAWLAGRRCEHQAQARAS